jgi:hypothetical protein
MVACCTLTPLGQQGDVIVFFLAFVLDLDAELVAPGFVEEGIIEGLYCW